MEEFRETYFGKEIVLSADQCYVLSTINQFRQNAEKVSKQYLLKYRGYQNFQVFSSQGIQDGYDMLKRQFNKTLDALIQMGHYDVNKAKAMEVYGGNILAPWAKIEEFVNENLSESNQRITQNEEYRDLRKASRGRVVGGGFGLKGAVGGMAMAGTLNALSGLAHSSVNAIGNARTRKEERDRLNQIYKSSKMTDCIRAVFTESFLQMAWVFLSYQGKYTEISLPGTEDDLTRAEALRENFEKIPAEKQPETAAQILTLAPSTTATYQFLLSKYQDPHGVLRKLAKAVGMEQTYHALLEQALTSEVQAETNHLVSCMKHVTIEEVNTSEVDHIKAESLHNLKILFERYGMNSKTDSGLLETYNQQLMQTYHSEVEKIRAEDLIKRSFRNVTYETYALAEQARQIWQKASDLEASCDRKSSVNIEKDIESLQSLIAQAPDALQTDLRILLEKMTACYKKKDQEERTYLGTIYPTREDRDEAEEKYNIIIKRWFLSKQDLTAADMQKARDAVGKQQDIGEPLRKAILERIDAKEQELIQNAILKEQNEKLKKQKEKSEAIGGIIAILNILYGVILLWALFFWKLFRIDGVASNAINLCQQIYLYHDSDVLTATRACIIIGIIVCAYQTISVIKNADFDNTLDHPGTVFILCLLFWGLTAFFHFAYDITSSYLILSLISLIFWIVIIVAKRKQ